MNLDILISSWNRLLSLTPKLEWPDRVSPLKTGQIAVISAGGAAGIWLLWRSYHYRNIPPGPPSLPVIGSVTGIHKDSLLEDFIELRKKYGGLYSIWFGNRLVVVLASYAAARDALGKQADAFAGRSEKLQEGVIEYMHLKDDVFASTYDPEQWVKNKNFLMNSLRGAGYGSTSSALVVSDKIEKMLTQLDVLAESQKPVDIKDILLKTTISTLFRILCGKEWEYDDPKIKEVLEGVVKWMHAFGEAMSLVELVPRWMAKLFYARKMQEISDDCQPLHDITHEEFLYHKETLDPDNPRDFIDLYLVEKGEEHDLKRMKDNTTVFMPDGTDTLSNILYFIMLYLSHYPEVQNKAAEEAESITGGNRYVTWDDRKEMPYVQAVIMEVMRLAMVFPFFVGHTVRKDVTLWGYRIPRSTDVYIAFDSIFKDPDVFADPDVFRPERFLDESSKLMKNEEWIPFSMGKRRCPGEFLAKMEMFLFIANIVQRYLFRFPDGDIPTLESAGNAALRLAHPYKLILTHRHPN